LALSGWVMSDWGAVHGALDAVNGLDQESGEQLDKAVFFDAPLKAAVLEGRIPAARVDDMVRRILRSMFAVGIDAAGIGAAGPGAAGPGEHPAVKVDIDYAAHRALALDIARKGIVLLKNDADLLPLARSYKKIAVIGGYANSGVLSGGGSAQVIPTDGPFARIPTGGLKPNWMDRCSILPHRWTPFSGRRRTASWLTTRCVAGARRGSGRQRRHRHRVRHPP